MTNLEVGGIYVRAFSRIDGWKETVLTVLQVKPFIDNGHLEYQKCLVLLVDGSVDVWVIDPEEWRRVA